MRKTFCDRCGEEIRETPDTCHEQLPKYKIVRIDDIGRVTVFARAVDEKEVDLCPHCVEAFEDFMAGMKTVQENRTGGVFDDPE